MTNWYYKARLHVYVAMIYAKVFVQIIALKFAFSVPLNAYGGAKRNGTAPPPPTPGSKLKCDDGSEAMPSFNGQIKPCTGENSVDAGYAACPFGYNCVITSGNSGVCCLANENATATIEHGASNPAEVTIGGPGMASSLEPSLGSEPLFPNIGSSELTTVASENETPIGENESSPIFFPREPQEITNGSLALDNIDNSTTLPPEVNPLVSMETSAGLPVTPILPPGTSENEKVTAGLPANEVLGPIARDGDNGTTGLTPSEMPVGPIGPMGPDGSGEGAAQFPPNQIAVEPMGPGANGEGATGMVVDPVGPIGLDGSGEGATGMVVDPIGPIGLDGSGEGATGMVVDPIGPIGLDGSGEGATGMVVDPIGPIGLDGSGEGATGMVVDPIGPIGLDGSGEGATGTPNEMPVGPVGPMGPDGSGEGATVFPPNPIAVEPMGPGANGEGATGMVVDPIGPIGPDGSGEGATGIPNEMPAGPVGPMGPDGSGEGATWFPPNPIVVEPMGPGGSGEGATGMPPNPIVVEPMGPGGSGEGATGMPPTEISISPIGSGDNPPADTFAGDNGTAGISNSTPADATAGVQSKPSSGDSMLGAQPANSVPAESSFQQTSGPPKNTSGVFTPCSRDSDCFPLREPSEWCQRGRKYTWTDKSCFCASEGHIRLSCIVERLDTTTKQTEWTYCAPKTAFKCGV